MLVLTDTFFFGVRRRRGDLYVCNECVQKARRIAQCRRKDGKCCAEKLRLPQKVIKPYTVRCCSAYVFLFLSFSIFPFSSVESHPRVKNRWLTFWETLLPRCVIPRGLTLRVFDGRGGLLCRILREQWRRWEIRQGDCVTPDLCDL